MKASTALLICTFMLIFISQAAAYCNLQIYKEYNNARTKTCGGDAKTFCDHACTAKILKWINYADACVAPNENTLPHPFLNDNGIEDVYEDDLKHFKAQYHHFCKKIWVNGASQLVSVSATLVFMLAFVVALML